MKYQDLIENRTMTEQIDESTGIAQRVVTDDMAKSKKDSLHPRLTLTGDKAEEAFRQSLLGSQGSLGVFFSNPLVGTIMVLVLIALFWTAIQEGYTRLRTAAT